MKKITKVTGVITPTMDVFVRWIKNEKIGSVPYNGQFRVMHLNNELFVGISQISHVCSYSFDEIIELHGSATIKNYTDLIECAKFNKKKRGKNE